MGVHVGFCLCPTNVLIVPKIHRSGDSQTTMLTSTGSQAGLSHSHGHPFSSKDAWPSSLAAAPDHPHVAGSPLLLSGLLSGPVASSLCQGCTWHPHSMAHGGPKSLGFWSHLAFTWGKGWFIYHLRKPLI